MAFIKNEIKNNSIDKFIGVFKPKAKIQITPFEFGEIFIFVLKV